MPGRRLRSRHVESLVAQSDAQLGKGATGRVYLVRSRGKLCALKVGSTPKLLEFYQREVDTMASLRGAGGSPIPLGFCPKVPAILMSYCGPESLYA